MKSITRGIGEAIEIIPFEGGDPHRTFGVYEDSYYSLQSSEVPVLVDSPSLIIRNSDISEFTSEYPLYRRNWKIKRLKNSVVYLITNYERDELSSVRYLLTEEAK